MQIYCFDIDGTPEWPSGTAVTAHDRRTSSTVFLYRSCDADSDAGAEQTAGATRSGSSGQAKAAARLEQRRRACAVLARLAETIPSTPTAGRQPCQRVVELFSCGDFMLLAAPDAITAAPVLSELRAAGLFHDRSPVLCSRCNQARPGMREGLCAACTTLQGEAEASAARKRQEELRKAVRRRRALKTLLTVSILVALTAVPLFLWLRGVMLSRTAAPVAAPIIMFSANHKSIRRGSRVLLSWNTSGLSGVTISPGIGRVAVSGTRWVVVNRDTTFSLIGTGTVYTSRATVFVTVIDR